MKTNEIKNIKLTKYYLNDGDLNFGDPISTSVELQNKMDDNGLMKWMKIITHTYCSFDNLRESISDITKILLENDNIITELNKLNLSDLKNNYYTNMSPINYSRWELSYNYFFRVVGTYDKSVYELKEIEKLINFDSIIEAECKKIEEKKDL